MEPKLTNPAVALRVATLVLAGVYGPVLAQGTVDSLQVSVWRDSVLQDGSVREFAVSGGAGRSFKVEILGFDSVGTEMIVPSPRLRVAASADTDGCEKWRWRSMSRTLFRSMDTLYTCCNLDHSVSPFALWLASDTVVLNVSWADVGCPMPCVEFTCQFACMSHTYVDTCKQPWHAGDTALFQMSGDTLRFINGSTSSAGPTPGFATPAPVKETVTLAAYDLLGRLLDKRWQATTAPGVSVRRLRTGRTVKEIATMKCGRQW